MVSSESLEIFNKINTLKDDEAYKQVHQCEYVLYESDEKELVVPTNLKKEKNYKQIIYVCFAGIGTHLAAKKYNRICYTPKNNFTPEESKIWIDLCVKNKMLPDRMGVSEDYKNFVLEVSPSPTPLLYIYLSNIRHLDEEKWIVKATIRLHCELGLDFIGAFTLATSQFTRSTGHVYLPSSHQKAKIEEARIELSWALGLKEFLREPNKYRQQMASGTFGAQCWIQQAKIKMEKPSHSMKLSYKGLRNPLITKALDCENDTEISKTVSVFAKSLEDKRAAGPKVRLKK